MEEHERQLALRYAPHVYFDKNETIPLALVGYDIHRGTRRSRSFRRTLAVDLEKAEFVIEYAYYFDYDIQHMYDLEHVWVWVGHDGQVVDAECSSHGQYVNCWRYRPQAEDGTHVAVYCQPGKHAFFPDGKLFLLFSNVYETCTKLASTAFSSPPSSRGGSPRTATPITWCASTSAKPTPSSPLWSLCTSPPRRIFSSRWKPSFPALRAG